MNVTQSWCGVLIIVGSLLSVTGCSGYHTGKLDKKLDAKAVIEHAQSAENKLALREQTEEAVRRRVFGAPTFFVGREMFWGNDRLEDAIACASRTGGAL